MIGLSYLIITVTLRILSRIIRIWNVCFDIFSIMVHYICKQLLTYGIFKHISLYNFQKDFQIFKMNQPIDTLEEKQKYLRENIRPQEYEDFYQYCEAQIGNVDVNSWSPSFIRKLVQYFGQYKERMKTQDDPNDHERTYNNYQSVEVGEKLEINKDEKDDDYITSKVFKSSAVSLLDEAFENSFVSNKNKGPAETKSLNFDEFDFWTNGCLSESNQNEVKNQSQNNFHGSNIQSEKPKRQSKKQIQNSPSQEYQFGSAFVNKPVVNKPKQSAYLKKQSPPEPYQANTHRSVQKKSINEFSQFHGNLKTKETKSNPKSVEKQIKPIKINSPPISSKNSKWQREEKFLNEEVTCFKSIKRQKIDFPDLNIHIDDKYEIVHRNFLAPDYPMYKMKVSPLGIECQRNYDDFAKLKKTLQTFFPAHHLAYLDDGSLLSGTKQQFILKQKKMLQLFMRDLLRNQQIRNSRVMQDFLIIKDHKSMKRKFEQFEKIHQPQGIEQLCLLEGKVNVLLSNEQTNYINNFNQFLHRMDDYYSRHRKLTESITKQYNNLMETYSSMIRLMSSIQSEIQSFNSKVCTNQLKHLKKIYSIVKHTYKQDFSNLKFDFEINEKKLTPFWKYEHENLLELKKMFEVEKKMHKNYQKRKATEKFQTRENYQSDSAKNGKKGVLQESKNMIVLKYQLGYIDNQCRKEGQRVLDQMGYKIIRQWQTFSPSYIDRYKKCIQYHQKLLKIDRDSFLPKK